jgi:hypothetical protein
MTTEEQAAADAAAAADKVAADAQTASDAAKAAAAGGGSGKTVAELEAELARTAAALTTANGEAATRKRKLHVLEQAEEARLAASLTDLEKEKKRADDAEAREKAAIEGAKTANLKAAFENAAYKAGVAHPEDVYRLADLSAVSTDDDGKITGVTEAVKALVDAGRVPMAASGPPPAPNLDGGAGGNHGNAGAAKLTADEIEMAGKMGVSLERAAAQKTAMQKEAVAV